MCSSRSSSTTAPHPAATGSGRAQRWFGCPAPTRARPRCSTERPLHRLVSTFFPFAKLRERARYAYPSQACGHDEGADLGFLSSEVKCLLATFFMMMYFIRVPSWDPGQRSRENHRLLAHWS
nr:uncharacterized protein LOC109740984 isoform X3 [Aegilops tauschii subsp. strangulata]